MRCFKTAVGVKAAPTFAAMFPSPMAAGVVIKGGPYFCFGRVTRDIDVSVIFTQGSIATDVSPKGVV